ncbi:MAG: cation diffusion facilitator family transporter [Eggerthellaceae bacterium]|nr:cation diffusion facilitator family transporter [Eggerthellaceae bacterium]
MGRLGNTVLAAKAACTPGACVTGGNVQPQSRKPAIVAMLSNLAIGAIKFVAAFFSGSSAMISEGIHSIVDSANAGILLYGMRRAKRKADAAHPFGYSSELYFWTLIVGIMLFMLGGGLSVLEGVSRFREISPGMTLGSPWLSYVIFAASLAIEGYALLVAVRSFNKGRKGKRPIRYLREARDPSMFAVLLEDAVDMLGLLLALTGTLIAHITGNLYVDALASIAIGVLLCSMAFTLLYETKSLLIGRGMTADDLAEVKRIVNGHANVESCTRALSLYLGPNDLLLTIEAAFTAKDIPGAIAQVEDAIIARFPQVRRIFIEPKASVTPLVRHEASRLEDAGKVEVEINGSGNAGNFA